MPSAPFRPPLSRGTLGGATPAATQRTSEQGALAPNGREGQLPSRWAGRVESLEHGVLDEAETARSPNSNAKMVIKADNGGSTSSPSPRAATTGSSSSVANAQYPPLVPLTTRTMGSEEFRRNKALWSEFLKRPGCSPRTVKDQAPRPIPRD
jgi:hypothetical protein